jgi:hypothetical protein
MPGVTSVDVVIEEETTEVTTTTATGSAQGIRVYLFSGTGSYLGLYDDTDADGKAFFDLPVGKVFKFRADIMGSQYWSDVVTIQAGVTNQVLVDAGGGILQVTVEKSPGNPMEGINTYLFTASGTYLGLFQVTDSSGIVEYSITDGDYKVRADYLGDQFWTQDTTVTENTSIALMIPHQDVVITVEGTYPTPNPIEGIPVYLFTASGSYMGQNQVTDPSGQGTFHLPEQLYKVRADYLGQPFWSSDFQWQDTTVVIPQGLAQIHVFRLGADVEGANAYLFTGAGSYLGWNETTDPTGMAEFIIPEGSYKFRADEVL